MSDFDEYTGSEYDPSEDFDDWGEWAQDWRDEVPFGYGDEDYDDDFDPATELVDIIDHGIVITEDGQVLSLQTRIYADEHTEGHQVYLEDSCDTPPSQLDDLPF